MKSKRKPVDELEPLWAVDPEVGVEGAAVLPQPRDLGVPALVRGERRAGERHPEQDGEERRARDWGPPCELTRRRLAVALSTLALAAGVALALVGLGWTPYQALLVLLVPSLAIGATGRYLRDFAPLTVAIVVYAELRGLAHVVQPHPFYIPQIRLERALFGWPLPTERLQQALWHGGGHWYDAASTAMLHLHSVVPPVVGYLLWMRRRALFYRFAASLLTLSFSAAVAFAVFPAAPPWAASRVGAIGSVLKLPTPVDPSPAFSFAAPQNPYAAIPSLHAGYAFLVALFLGGLFLRSGHRYRWPAIALCAAYPLAQSLVVMYTGNHYIVDILCGYAFAGASLWLVNRVWTRRGLPA
jgi:membrane-associated phospholipid phosphatase